MPDDRERGRRCDVRRRAYWDRLERIGRVGPPSGGDRQQRRLAQGKGVGIGLAAGIGAGFLFGQLLECRGGCDDPRVATELGLGLGICASSGFIVGSMNRSERSDAHGVIYRAT